MIWEPPKIKSATVSMVSLSICIEVMGPESILPWEIPWAEEPGGLLSMGLQRVGYD